jgi:beta-lactamase regulating signal transducer with metallopeptidase domain
MSGVLTTLIELNVAAAAAILFVLLARAHVTRAFGPHAAYAVWSMVPVAMLATLLPERTTETLVTEFLIGGLPASLAHMKADAATSWQPIAISAAWLAGAIALALLLIRRQRAFLRDADLGLAGPAIVGFRHPRIVTPDDFVRRFSHDERKLILTHEQVHIDRADARINAVVALLRCLFWFNPLVHVGANAMRIDQEMSCDAEVIARRPRVRRQYAETLLKTHLATRPLPVGCYWPAESQHPLAQRISEIARAPISRRRSIAAAAIVMTLTTAAGIAAWAAQPERTIFRETADVLVPFEPLDRNGRSTASFPRPQLIPAALKAPAGPLHRSGDAELTAGLCMSAAGRVTSVTLAVSSSHPVLHRTALSSVRDRKFMPAKVDGDPQPVCGHGVDYEWKLNR